MRDRYVFTEHGSVIPTELILDLNRYCKNIPFFQAQAKTEISIVLKVGLPVSLYVFKTEELIN